MSETPNEPVGYRVSYSERVRVEVKILLARARERGLGNQVFEAVKEIDRRLHIYPQFGDPLQDLQQKPLQLRIGVVPPLVVHYCLDDEKKLVMVGTPIKPLSRSGLDP